MTISEFNYFSKLVLQAWYKCHKEVPLESPISEYESKLMELEATIENETIHRTIISTPPISKRSLREYIDAVINQTPDAINPQPKTKDILSRYVLSAPKLIGENLAVWDQEKLYMRNEYWNRFKSLNKDLISSLTSIDSLESGESNTFQKLPKSKDFDPKLSRKRLVLFALIAIALLITSGLLYFKWYRTNETINPEEVSHDYIEFYEYSAHIDLTNWTKRPQQIHIENAETSEAWWPDEIAIRTNKLIISRSNSSATKLIMRIGTGGDPPALFCLTHNYKIIQRHEPFFFDQQARSGWFIEIDISEAPIDFPFVILYQVVYKNGFQGTPQFSVAWSDKDWDKISIEVEFPKHRPFSKSFGLYEYKMGRNEKITPYHGLPDTIQGPGNTYARWDVENPKLNYSYRIQWEW